MNLIKSYLKKHYLGAAFLIAATMASNVINFAFNAYLGRALTLDEFSLISLIGSLYGFASIGFIALGSVATYKGGLLIGRYGDEAGRLFLKHLQKISIIISISVSSMWLLLTPFLSSYFHTTYSIILLLTPIWFFGFLLNVNKGYISSKLQFGILGAASILEPIIKLTLAFIFIQFKEDALTYLSVPFSIVAACLLTAIILRQKSSLTQKQPSARENFPVKFFLTSLISGLSTLSFVSLDVILARHYLPADQAGQYALISLIGKMVYFMSGLSSQFVIPLISHSEGKKQDSKGVFYKILFATFALTLVAFVPLGILANIFTPILFGAKVLPVLKFLPMFLLAMMAFSVSRVFVNYYQVKKIYIFSVLAFLLSIIQILLLSAHHSGVSDFVNAMVTVGILNLAIMVTLHLNLKITNVLEFNFADFTSLFIPHKSPKSNKGRLNILIFNWRDTKHKWSGGAETYIHEIAKRWVEDGNSVTIFCGNDYKSKKNETVNGVYIMRRGGFYTMYAWAAVYYVLKLRGKYDVIVDSENGIPFFTPLFARKPIILLIHHVHQDIFVSHMKFPLSYIGKFIEGKLMPFVYRNKTVVTVSNSSRDEIVKLGIAKGKSIEIINPGINIQKNRKSKTKHPTFVYLGRLKPYKNIDIAIKAFAKVSKIYKNAQFFIVGDGESRLQLETLTKTLRLENKVTFFGKVSEKEKVNILARSWIAIQPSTVEGWGITVIEANMCGVPVIASNTNGLRDSIDDGKTGLLFKVKSIQQLAENMRFLTKNKKLRKEMSQRAFLWSKKYSWDAASFNLFSIAQNEVARKKSPLSAKALSYLNNIIGSIF